MNTSPLTLTDLMEKLQGRGYRELDLQFAKFLQGLDESCDALALMGFLLSHTVGKGNVCLDCSKEHEWFTAQQLTALLENVSDSIIVKVLSPEQLMQDNIELPLVLHGQRLYLQRYWLYEVSLHQSMQQKMVSMDSVSYTHLTLPTIYSV